uniref:Seipin n=1 Tax=Strongyloides venezuelensis TaxID=75913 RepID=A0A0K0FKD6_STRVS
MMKSHFKIPEERKDFFSRLPLFLQPPEWVSMSLIVVFIVQLFFLLIISLILPLFFRHIFLNSENNYERSVEFTYDSCNTDDDYYGTVCSFLSSNINLREDGFYFKKNVAYSISLNLVLRDSTKNKKISSFITSMSLIKSTKEDNVVRFKRLVNLKWSWIQSTLIWWRNFFFYPLYLIGVLQDNIISVSMVFTNKFIINDSKFTINNIVVQVESRQVEIENANVFIIPYRTLLQSLLFEFPVISYFVLLFIFFTLLSIIFSLVWIKKINNTRNNFYELKLDLKNSKEPTCDEEDNWKMFKLKLRNETNKLTSIIKDFKTPSPPNCEMHKYFNLDSIPGWNSENNFQSKNIDENVLRKRKT